MINMTARRINYVKCESDLREFATFLASKAEIDETGRGSLQEFFDARPDLTLLMGIAFFSNLSPAAYCKEFSVLGEFRADYAICNEERNRFVFVEFEDAKAQSIFKIKNDGKTTTTYEWSPKFEHGFSQVVDWHYRMDDLERSNKYSEHFGCDHVEFVGILVVGRKKFLDEAGGEKRLWWRKNRTAINSKQLNCMTFDQLYSELLGRYDTLTAAKSGKLL